MKSLGWMLRVVALCLSVLAITVTVTSSTTATAETLRAVYFDDKADATQAADDADDARESAMSYKGDADKKKSYCNSLSTELPGRLEKAKGSMTQAAYDDLLSAIQFADDEYNDGDSLWYSGFSTVEDGDYAVDAGDYCFGMTDYEGAINEYDYAYGRYNTAAQRYNSAKGFYDLALYMYQSVSNTIEGYGY